MKLVDFMKKVEAIYRESGEQYVAAAKKEAAAREEIKKTRSSRELTQEGKEKRIAKLQEEIREHKAEMAAIAATAKEKALGVRKSCEEYFFGRFHATPDALDMPALELLKSGIMTDSEIVALAQKFKGNCTMERLCGSYLEKSMNQEISGYGRALQLNSTDPHLRAIDAVMDAGNYILGGAPLSGAAGAETFLKRFDEILSPTYAAAPDL